MTRPSLERIRLAKLWWQQLADSTKGNAPIWEILALYAEYVLRVEGAGGNEKSGAA